MNVGDVQTVVSEIATEANAILDTVKTLDPALAPEISLVEEVAALAIKGLTAWSAASNTPITAESILALMPNPTPLTPPRE